MSETGITPEQRERLERLARELADDAGIRLMMLSALGAEKSYRKPVRAAILSDVIRAALTALDTFTAQVASLAAERDELQADLHKKCACDFDDFGSGKMPSMTPKPECIVHAARTAHARADAFAEAVTVVEQAQVVDAGNLDWDAACDYILTKLREAAAHHGATPTEGQ